MLSAGSVAEHTWFEHLGYHLASYGYIVVAHQTLAEAGPDNAALHTLGHTDAFLDQLDNIAEGALVGHVDTHRIVWIGHSRAGEGIAVAYDLLVDDPASYVPTYYSVDDILLVSPMAPTDFGGFELANPHDAHFALWSSSGDALADGSAGCEICQSQHLYDRATGFRHSFVIQGAGHFWFTAFDGSSFQDGPCPIGRVNTNLILKGYYLPLLAYYTQGNIPAADFFWRQHERFRPIGIPGSDPCIVVNKTYHNGAAAGNFVIDDFQYGAAGTGYDDPDVSSSGGAISYTVTNLFEGVLDDNNSTFTWTSSDPMNGMTHSGVGDDARGVVFDWDDADLYYEQELVSGQRDLRDYLYLSFRAAQGTQHPRTIATLGDLDFTVTLRDAAGLTSSINIAAYGGGIEEPYQRAGGWFNEFETIRLRLMDFLAEGAGLDLSDVVAVRLNFGPSWGEPQGRLALDDLELTNDYPAYGTPQRLSLVDAQHD